MRSLFLVAACSLLAFGKCQAKGAIELPNVTGSALLRMEFPEDLDQSTTPG